MKPNKLHSRVGIFGGSFDPVHNGHISIARSFLDSGFIEQLLILPAPAPPHKQSETQAPFRHRVEMLKRAFSSMENAVVSSLEEALPAPSYTLQTLRYLEQQYPESRFFLCIGEDSLQDFHTWHRFEEILEKVPIVVAQRPGFNSLDVPEAILERTIFIEHTAVDVSSTDYRKEPGTNILPDAVIDYIRENKLYQ